MSPFWPRCCLCWRRRVSCGRRRACHPVEEPTSPWSTWRTSRSRTQCGHPWNNLNKWTKEKQANDQRLMDPHLFENVYNVTRPFSEKIKRNRFKQKNTQASSQNFAWSHTVLRLFHQFSNLKLSHYHINYSHAFNLKVNQKPKKKSACGVFFCVCLPAACCIAAVARQPGR